jgi:peptidoglycan/LPS O-acetylase OafA/YrhL
MNSAQLAPAVGVESSAPKNRFNLLRLVFAILVLLAHAPELIDGDRHREPLSSAFGTLTFGEFAVDGFFLLSGYLILQSWMRNPSLKPFLRNRVLRIVPGFAVASLLSVLVVGPLGASAVAYFHRLHPLAVARDLLLLRSPRTPPVFSGQPYGEVNGSLWTIEYEFRCYLLVALFGSLGLARRRWTWPLMFAICAALGQWSGVPEVPFKGASLLFAKLPSLVHFLSCFLAGGTFFLFRDRIRYSLRWALVVLPAFLACLLHARLAALAMPTLGGWLLFAVAFARPRKGPLFVPKTDVSYGVYLYGWPVQKLLIWYVPWISPWILFFVSSVACVALGALSWTLVESRFLKLKASAVVAPTAANAATDARSPGGEQHQPDTGAKEGSRQRA